MSKIFTFRIQTVLVIGLLCSYIPYSNAQNPEPSSNGRGFDYRYRQAMTDLQKRSLEKTRADLELDCLKDRAPSCAKLCFWQLMDKENKKALSNCSSACRLGNSAACLGENLVRRINANPSDNPSSIIAKYMLDLTCKNDDPANCDPVSMRNELNAVLNKNATSLAWAVGLGCKRGLKKSCNLANYFAEAPNLSEGGQDLVQALIDYSCNEQSVEACAVGALFKGMHSLGGLSSKLFDRNR